MTEPLPFWVRRLIAVVFCIMLAIFGLYMFLILFTDLDSPTPFDNFCFALLGLLAWPFIIFEFIYGNDPRLFSPWGISMSGLVWALLLGLLFRWMDRRKAKQKSN
jgi:hypothetical protein